MDQVAVIMGAYVAKGKIYVAHPIPIVAIVGQLYVVKICVKTLAIIMRSTREL